MEIGEKLTKAKEKGAIAVIFKEPNYPIQT